MGSQFQLERQKRDSENLSVQKQRQKEALKQQNSESGNGEQTMAIDMETRESRSEEKAEQRASEEKKRENRESSGSSHGSSSSSSSGYPGGPPARPAHAHQADPRPQHFPMPNHMFQQAFPYGPPGGGHHQFTPPNYGHGHMKHGGGRTSGSITEIEPTASASVPGTPVPDGFDAHGAAQQQQQHLPPPSHSHPHPPTPEEVQCTPSLPF